MKKIYLISFLAIGVLLNSCSKDDGPTTSGNLLGKWYHKEYKVSGLTIPYDDHEDCGKDYIEFTSATQGRSVDVFNCVEESDPFTYVRNGNSITVTSSGFSDTAQIIELSATTLKVKTTYDFDDNGSEETVIEVYTRS